MRINTNVGALSAARNLGSVHRSHIITNMSAQDFAISQKKPRPKFGNPTRRRSCSTGWGARYPPKKMTDVTAEMMSISVYSAMKNIAKKNPLYSVWNPATSSIYASGMSKVARLHSAIPAVKKIRKAIGMIGK